MHMCGYRTVSFLSNKLSDSQGVTYHKCNILELPKKRPLLAVVAAEPSTNVCPPATMMNFIKLSGIEGCSGQ